MNTRVIEGTDPTALGEAMRVLRAGGVVAFPTDTVYGVGCDLWSPVAVERLYAAKGRPPGLAIPVLVSSPEHVGLVAQDVPPAYAELVARFWPGALTVVVRRRPEVPVVLTAGKPTVAVRMPAHDLALRLIAAVGGALAVTSANLSGRPPAETAEQVWADLGGRIALVIDGGRAPVGLPSSIVDLTFDPPRLLREGALPFDALREVLPGLARG